MNRSVIISPGDNVMVLTSALAGGELERGITLAEAVPAGHKVALFDIPAGGDIIKYGNPIGRATRAIVAGEWVHTHNVRTLLDGALSYSYQPASAGQYAGCRADDSFMGYVRPGDGAGVRNEVWIIPTVGCVSHTAQIVAERARAMYAGRTDGIFAFSHVHGCSQMGRDLELTQLLLAGLINHPNAGAVLVMGLGCEYNGVDDMKRYIGENPPGRVEYIVCQDEGDEVAAALDKIGRLVEYAVGFDRISCPASLLTVGLKCGGSDGYSGITANPLLGRLSDRLCAQGGRTLLTEVPEMFGAEHILMSRCSDAGVYERTVSLINDFKRYLKSYGEVISENPSPGNKEGGITTLEDKSLGCIQKGGGSPVNDVLDIGCPARAPGLSLVDGPGNDLCASTILAAAGAQIILFTTGRGTPYGGPVPTLKISTNTYLSERKPGWIDFDAGTLAGGDGFEAAADALCALTLEIASGRQAKNELGGYREIAIFKDGVTL